MTTIIFVDQTKDTCRKCDERNGKETGDDVDATGPSLGNWENS